MRLELALTALSDLYAQLKSDPVNRTAILYQIHTNAIRAKVLVRGILSEILR
jgi:hypothetical protein